MHQGLARMKIPLLVTLTAMMVLLGLSLTTPAGAATTSWEAVDVTSAPFEDTMADGTVVTITFGPAAGFWGGTYPPAIYKTDASGPITNSTVRFSFDRPVKSLKTYYAFVGQGDQEEFSTNLGPVNLADTVAEGGNLVSSTGGFISGQPEGTYSTTGIVTSTFTAFNQDNSAALELFFSTGVTYLEVRGAPSGPGTAGINLTGLELPVTAYDVVFEPNGGVGEMSDQTIYASSSLVPNAFTRQGFEFTGWNTQANGKGTFYANEADIPAADITLFAQWRSTELAKTGFDARTEALVFLGVFGFGTFLLMLSRIAPRADRALERASLGL
jgi:uncharacterized repeat protein (TIGR02543 family)